MQYFPITVMCLGLLAIGFPALAKDPKTQKPDTQTMMETYKKLATPGEQHKKLAEQEGTWTTNTKHWMEPGKPPEESIGTCENRVILEGRRTAADAA